jgi:hypothetical protein
MVEGLICRTSYIMVSLDNLTCSMCFCPLGREAVTGELLAWYYF